MKRQQHAANSPLRPLFTQAQAHRKLQCVLSISLSILITSCATLPSQRQASNQKVNRPKRKQQLKQIKQFSINGAIAVKEKNTGFTASLKWQQSSINNFTVQLFGPLGAGNVLLRSNNGTVTLKDRNTEKKGRNASALLYKSTGHHLPLKQMYYWVRGLAYPGSSAKKQLDRFNHLNQLSQSGWKVSYTKYTEQNNIDLPSKINLYSKNIKIKLIISNWKI